MKVLLAIDGSPHSHAALMELATRLWPHGTQVQILTVIHPTMPLFLEPNGCVQVPLEAAYQTAYAVLPRRWQRVLEAPPS